jgi:hypothetical protein
MEATGVYWKPVWAILEDEFDCLFVNGRHVKQVPSQPPTAARAASSTGKPTPPSG